jgi:hypothetical protein
MLKHCVFVNFQSKFTATECNTMLAKFEGIGKDVPGMLDYAFGPNLDFEKMSAQYTNGFIITFQDRAAHLAYETHPDHLRLGAKMVEMCNGGVDGIIVFDLEV